MIKNILSFDPFSKNNSKILKYKTKTIKNFSNIKHIVNDLNDTLENLIQKYNPTRGIGISAPQIGYSSRISIVKINNIKYILINPKIIKKSSKKRLFRIGCFSLYKYRGLVKYPEKITIEYYDKNIQKKTLTVLGDSALIIQHELDHLDGILLFDRLPNKEKDLFIPRETIYKTAKVPLNNYGWILKLKKKLKIKIKVQTTEQYYSFLFNDSYDVKSYVKSSLKKRKELVETIKRYTPLKGKILEAGCGTSAISVGLSKDYSIKCIDLNENMLNLAKRINLKNKGNVIYAKENITNIKNKNEKFDIVYSHGVLEHFIPQDIIKAINEGLKVSKTYIISIPTIWDVSNNLLGDENLWSINF